MGDFEGGCASRDRDQYFARLLIRPNLLALPGWARNEIRSDEEAGIISK